MAWKKWLGWGILWGSITITIPDIKDAKVLQARNLYNTRTGQSLTTAQWIKELTRQAVIIELVNARIIQEKLNADAAKMTFDTALQVERTTTEDLQSTEGGGW